MVAGLLIVLMMQIAKHGSRRYDRRSAFLLCTGVCERSLRVN
jgi:hypothetical protein